MLFFYEGYFSKLFGYVFLQCIHCLHQVDGNNVSYLELHGGQVYLLKQGDLLFKIKFQLQGY